MCQTAQIVPDNYLYARVALVVKDKGSLSEEKLPELAEVLADEAKAKEVSGGNQIDAAAAAGATVVGLLRYHSLLW
jgi:RNA processing factor Prp31